MLFCILKFGLVWKNYELNIRVKYVNIGGKNPQVYVYGYNIVKVRLQVYKNSVNMAAL